MPFQFRSVIRCSAVAASLAFARRITIGLFVLAAGLAFTSQPVAAQQSATTGTFRGRVMTADGQPVAGAQVIARNTTTGFQRAAITNAEGRYVIPLLPPGGPYTLRATSIGYQDAERTVDRAIAGDAATVNLTMAVQAVEISAVTVFSSAARVDVNQGGVIQRVGTQQVENLPVNGRDFTDFLNLSPLISPQPEIGTGGQFAVAGARASGTNIQIDGADANNIFFGENRGSSRTPFAFSLESIREFQLITNGFDVEYGNYQGGVVNVVTRGGTNEFRGSGFYFHRNEALTAKDFNGLVPTDYRVQQFGFSLGGPLQRDRAHFFVSLDGQDKANPIFAATPVSADVSNAGHQRVLDALRSQYGIQNPERYFGQFDETEDNLVLFGRVDWNITGDHRLTLRQNYSNFKQENDRISSSEALTNGGPFIDKTWSTVGELNSILGGSAFNVLRLQWSYEDRPRDANEDGGYLPQFSIRGVPAASGTSTRTITFGGDGIIFRNRLEESKLQLVDNFSYRTGDHTLKLGTNNILANTKNEFWLFGNGSYTFNTLAAFESNTPANFSRNTRRCPEPLVANAAGETVICPNPDVPFADFTFLEWSAYAQDEWQVTDRLELTGGVRVGGTSFQDEPQQAITLEQAFGISSTIVPDFTSVSPRLSLTYDFSADQSRVLRAGVGLLVGRAPTVLAGNAFQTERPLLSVFCTGTNVPTIDMQDLLAAPRGENNPSTCRSGADPTGRPEFTVFSPDFELPKTLKANVGYNHQIQSTNTSLGIDAIFSRTEDNFIVQDLNLCGALGAAQPFGTFCTGPQFRLTAETADAGDPGRPVFVPRIGTGAYSPSGRAGTSRLVNGSFDRVYNNLSEGEARSLSLAASVEQQIGTVLSFGVRYAYTRAYDNSTFSCCTSNEGFAGETTAGDPNFVGDPDDDTRGNWGPSRFERRNVIVTNFIYEAPWQIRVNGIWRSQSGTPYSPIVFGDINGDGQDQNDRPFVTRDRAALDSDASVAVMDSLLAEHECLREAEGRIIGRNTCRNPWFHSLDLRVAKEISTFRGQRAEILVDLFNVLNGLNDDWGRFMGVFGRDQVKLYDAERHDLLTGRNVYSANPAFGKVQPSGFDPFQFQAQIGVRYRF